MSNNLKGKAKRVTTYNNDGKENGWLMELCKDGNKTVSYLTATKPGGFKGYHLHKVRASRYVCIKGGIKVILFENKVGVDDFSHVVWSKNEYFLLEGDTLYIPPNVPTGLHNITDEENWLVNYPDPYYDPNLVGEQVEYTLQELEEGVIK